MIRTLVPFWDHRELLANLTQRELRVRYRRSVLGWTWSLINPAMTAAIYSFVFVVVFRAAPAPGRNTGNPHFAFFLLAGTLPWGLLANGLNSGIGAVTGSSSLITRVYFPRELIPTSAVLSMVVSLAIELSVLVALQLVVGYNVLVTVPAVAALIVLQSLFVLGISYWLAALNVRYRDVQHLVAVMLLVWFYLTPIVYDTSFVASDTNVLGLDIPLRSVLMFNPMSQFVDAYRSCLYHGEFPSAGALGLCVGWSLVSFTFGLRYFRSRSRTFAEDL
jgi:lipopolysaccharide transport system permease protein